MAKYHVEVGYRTKRGGVALGMEVEAFGPEEAEEIAERKTLKGYPARKWCYTKVSESNTTTVRMPL